MSNKTKQQFPTKPPATDASVPPRYQPPPLPPCATGILKNPPKDNKIFKLPDNVTPINNPNAKYFPHNNLKGYPYPYPVVGLPQTRAPEDARTTTQAQVHQVRAGEEIGVPQIIVGQQQQQRRYTEDELLRPEMLKFVRKPEDNNRVIAEQTRHVQNMVAEIRSLKEANQRLADDNQELRDLCCFLDDDRQKGRKLAREWQRFGRYTASVMRQEVSAYQSKLRELDNKQQELIKDNLELKELCLYLDEERGGNSICPFCGGSTGGNVRDDGDGSSSSTNADEPNVPREFGSRAGRERILHENLVRQRSTFNDQIMQYVRSLEQRVKQLEEDKLSLTHKINQIATQTGDASLAVPTESSGALLSGRPEAVVRALQVLEVREQLERENGGNGRMPGERESVSDTASADMDDGEKALVREMCNVVWRKLEEAPQSRR